MSDEPDLRGGLTPRPICSASRKGGLRHTVARGRAEVTIRAEGDRWQLNGQTRSGNFPTPTAYRWLERRAPTLRAEQLVSPPRRARPARRQPRRRVDYQHSPGTSGVQTTPPAYPLQIPLPARRPRHRSRSNNLSPARSPDSHAPVPTLRGGYHPGGTAVRRYGGTAVRRYGGTAVRRYGGTAVRRYGGTDLPDGHRLVGRWPRRGFAGGFGRGQFAASPWPRTGGWPLAVWPFGRSVRGHRGHRGLGRAVSVAIVPVAAAVAGGWRAEWPPPPTVSGELFSDRPGVTGGTGVRVLSVSRASK